MLTFQRLRNLAALAGQIGFINTAKLAWSKILPRSYEIKLRPPGFTNCLYCRSGDSSDPYLFRNIFALGEYAPVDLREPKLILDCGANVGYASAYFLERFPSAHLVAVEPDPGNILLLEKNLSPFMARAEVIQGGVWSSTGELVTVAGEFLDGREWSTTVRKAESNEIADTRAFDIPSIIPAGYLRVDLLKVDIEGSETELFCSGTERWLPMIDNIVIELHGPEAHAVFFHSLSGYDYILQTSGELTICRNLKPKSSLAEANESRSALPPTGSTSC